jgi:hypothetical protein
MTPEEIEQEWSRSKSRLRWHWERRVGRFFAQGAIGAARERPRNP